MNDASESACRIEAGFQRVNGREAHTVSGHQEGRAPPEEMIQFGGHQRADDRPVWSPSLRSRALGAQHYRNDEFMTVFSHELRNSLSAIRGAAHILGVEAAGVPAALKARVLIERQVVQMTRLVEDLLDVSRVRLGQLRLQFERVDLCAVTAQAAQAVDFVMQQQQLNMTTSSPDMPVWVWADAVRMEQVLVNLLLNAAKFTEKEGHVVLSLEADRNTAVVRISDTGVGIAPEFLPHVFDLFVRANPTSRRGTAGLGIGLALVRSLVECHGGRVTAASAGVRQGSEFTVRLPTLVA